MLPSCAPLSNELRFNGHAAGDGACSHDASTYRQQWVGAEPQDHPAALQDAGTASTACSDAAAFDAEMAAAPDMQMADEGACQAEPDEIGDSSSTSSECSGSQHHATSSPHRDMDMAAWLADHGQVS